MPHNSTWSAMDRFKRPALRRTTVAGITTRAVAMQRTRSSPLGGSMPVSPRGVPCATQHACVRARAGCGHICAVPVGTVLGSGGLARRAHTVPAGKVEVAQRMRQKART